MNQRLILLLMLVLFIGMTALIYTLHLRHDKQQQQLLHSQQSAQKQIADLNDRLVAVARQQGNSPENTSTLNSSRAIGLTPSQQMQLNQQQNTLRQQQRQWTLSALNLTQDSLRQGNLKNAQQLLLELQQNIIEDQQDFGNVFNNTLLQTLKIDQLNIAQQATHQQQARASLNQSLLQVQQQLNLMAVQAPRSLLQQPVAQTGIANWFKHLLLVERAGPEVGQHMLNRNFIYKQASINIAIARLALGQNDQVNFTSNLNEALTQLYLLPDPASQQIAQQLKKLKNQPWPTSIELTSLTLLTGQKSPS